MDKTAGNTRLTLILALSDIGRAEITDMAKAIAREAVAGQLNPDTIDETTIQQHLYNPEIPDVDLMIRTGGDLRISNFLLWQVAYAELFFTPVLWPDFSKEDLREIVAQFGSRERRFGKTGEQVRAH
jgi:undecaprenyl diphosphate synthase